MKKYLIDDHTLKKFVTKIYASEAGDQITAVIKPSKNERYVFYICFWTKSYQYFRENSPVRKKLPAKKRKRDADTSAKKTSKSTIKKRQSKSKPKQSPKPTRPASPVLKPESDHESTSSNDQESGADLQSNSQSPTVSPVQSDQSDWDNGFWCEENMDWP